VQVLKYLLFFFAVVLPGSICIAQGKWELKRNDNGIEVYSREPVSGDLKEVRVVCILKTNKAQLIKTVQDIDNYKNWVYSTKTNKILKVVSPQELIYYTISTLPWPLKDRDLIVQLKILPSASSDKFQIEAKSLPDYLPRKKNFIRAPYSLAIWNVTVLNDKELKVDYVFSVNPGGSVPAWAVNSTLTVGPYNSFLKLKEVLAR